MNILVFILLVVLLFGPGIFQSNSLGQFFWATLHNEVAHPLLGFQTKWTFRFHDWSEGKLDQFSKTKHKKSCRIY